MIADDGECTLREAIIAANGNATSGISTGECAAGAAEPAVDRILFDTGVAGSIDLSSSLGSISEAVEITGPGASTLAIDGSGFGSGQRILSVLDETTIEGLTFRNASTGDSGALRVAAPTSIRDCAFEDNAAADGGAIRSASNLTVERCRFTRNIASDFGGGAIRTASSDRLTTIRDSLFESNESQGGFAPGGAIRVDGTGHVTEISGSTFTGNDVTGGGDGGAVQPHAVDVRSLPVDVVAALLFEVRAGLVVGLAAVEVVAAVDHPLGGVVVEVLDDVDDGVDLVFVEKPERRRSVHTRGVGHDARRALADTFHVGETPLYRLRAVQVGLTDSDEVSEVLLLLGSVVFWFFCTHDWKVG